jgi:hypothetical protein
MDATYIYHFPVKKNWYLLTCFCRGLLQVFLGLFQVGRRLASQPDLSIESSSPSGKTEKARMESPWSHPGPRDIHKVLKRQVVAFLCMTFMTSGEEQVAKCKTYILLELIGCRKEKETLVEFCCKIITNLQERY